ncbi:hypothetical protein FBZ93_110317 [Bradyrhizobium macuxiense]|uniref:Uncharacterized protein n=2 Tax=Bradyrhizobium macuxiense TaxID=1755647 RepID=A0A560LK84_9BRAD|nr:hypothetical protein FBZ93_110317 [Bradyrhizobium macuxiense]
MGDRAVNNWGSGGVMKRIVAAALLAASVGLLLPAGQARAQSAAAEARIGEAPVVRERVVERRHLRRVPIYRSRPDHWEPDVIPRYNPGPNAVRECTATYVQEHRPSGTVITPRMNCFWRPG